MTKDVKIMFNIAVVEDEKNLASLVGKYLTNEGYEYKIFYSGEEALKHIEDDFQLWILDIMLPGVTSGYDLIKKLKEIKPEMPVIFTSARDQDIDKIMGLELGSDDYLAKPYNMRELMLRIKKILERTYKEHSTDLIKYSEYEIDLDKRRVFGQNGEVIVLTSKEYDLLCFLMENKNKALSREQIIEHVWGDEYFGSDRVVDDLLRRLRAKMPNINVETIYGYGYRLLW